MAPSLADTLKDISKDDSDFRILLERLERNHFTHDCCPQLLSNEFTDSINLLRLKKRNYLRTLFLTNIIQKLRLNAVSDKNGSTQFIEILDQKLRTISEQEPEFLKENGSYKYGENSHQMKEFEKRLAQLIQSNLKDLVSKLHEIYFFDSESCFDLDSTSLALSKKVDEISNEIDNFKQSSHEIKRQNSEIQEKTDFILYGLITRSIPSIKSYIVEDDEFVNNLKLYIDFYATKIEYLELKMKTTKVELLQDTYDDDNMNALNNVKTQLERKLYVAKNKFTHYQRSLETYNNLGDDFKLICDKYTTLQKQSDDKKWALNTL